VTPNIHWISQQTPFSCTTDVSSSFTTPPKTTRMTSIYASHYRNPLNGFAGKKHSHPHRFRPRQSTRSAFYQPGLRVALDEPSTATANDAQQEQQHNDSRHDDDDDRQITPEGHWGFRPSALQHEDYGRGSMSVPEIVDWYVRDNERAEKEKVAVPSHPLLSNRHRYSTHQHKRGLKDALFTASSSSLVSLEASMTDAPSKSSSVLRCLQWNIQAFSSPKDERNMHTITAGIIRAICETDSDVLILNEIHWRDCHGDEFYLCESTKKVIETSQSLLEEVLRLRGYHYSRVASHGDTPTMVVTRKKVLKTKELILSDNRSALCMLLETTPNGSCCWVVGTHLDAFCAERRRSEIQTLLDEAARHRQDGGSSIPVLIAGDFNQQRCKDYAPSEWKQIGASADLRGVPRDDGVADLLEKGGFLCVLDDVRSSHREQDDDADEDSSRSGSKPRHGVACNWNQAQPPPSTHWSGTTIDYTYYYNHKQTPSDVRPSHETSSAANTTTAIAPHGIYVGPAGFSDHRLTVTDWILTTITHKKALSEGPRPNHIDKSFFFHHLPEGRHNSWVYNK